jgi:enamidase
MEILAGLGLGTMGAITAATAAAADTLQLEGAGRVEPGSLADLLVVAGDPSTDLGALARPGLVIQDGEFVV